MMKVPCELALAERSAPVSKLLTLILESETAAPAWSRTVPLSVPVCTCPIAEVLSVSATRNTHSRFILPSKKSSAGVRLNAGEKRQNDFQTDLLIQETLDDCEGQLCQGQTVITG